MTIIEAISSGKLFRRKHWDEWLSYNSNVNNGYFFSQSAVKSISGVYAIGNAINLYYEDVIATDWEVK